MDKPLAFGKFKGQYIRDLPSYYIYWLKLHSYDLEVRQAAQDEWAKRNTWGGHWAMPKEKRFS